MNAWRSVDMPQPNNRTVIHVRAPNRWTARLEGTSTETRAAVKRALLEEGLSDERYWCWQ